jgi:hypothetical protein
MKPLPIQTGYLYIAKDASGVKWIWNGYYDAPKGASTQSLLVCDKETLSCTLKP